MVTLEQVKLLETKVARAIEFVNRVTEENTSLKGKLDDCQKRIDEFEVLIQRFKDDQGRIEDGILSALDRLSQFEAAMERSISPAKTAGRPVPDGPGENGTEPEGEPEPVETQSEPAAFPGKLFVEDEGEESDEEILFAADEEDENETVIPSVPASPPPAIPEEQEELSPSPDSAELDIF
jgi:chromosome segregation ATPase